MILLALALQLVTSPIEYVSKNPDKSIKLTTAYNKVSPPVKKDTVVFRCEGLPGFTYAVKGTECPVPVVVQPLIAPPVITTVCKDAPNAKQWTYASKGGTYGNMCILSALDAVRLSGPTHEPRVFQDISIANARHFIIQNDEKWQPYSNVTAQRFDVTVRKRGIYLRGGSDNWLIQDFRITGKGINTAIGDITVGIATKNATNITVRRGYIGNFISQYPAGKYLQGDGFSNERGDTANISQVIVEDVSDGAFDVKGYTILNDTIGRRAGHYTYRFWAKAEAGTITSEDPGGAHVQLAATSADVHIKKLIAIGGKTLIRVDKPGGKLVMDACDLTKWTGTTLVSGPKADITYGPGCRK